jgi:PIN domain.
MRVFDASSMIYAWDNYPIGQFPGLWDWMGDQIDSKELVMSSVAFDEVSHIAPECGEWLKDNDLERLKVNNAIIQDALRIKGLLGIVDDSYHSKGVGENDILIIATARQYRAELVSDEERQTNLPQVLSAICITRLKLKN